MKETRKFLLLF